MPAALFPNSFALLLIIVALSSAYAEVCSSLDGPHCHAVNGRRRVGVKPARRILKPDPPASSNTLFDSLQRHRKSLSSQRDLLQTTFEAIGSMLHQFLPQLIGSNSLSELEDYEDSEDGTVTSLAEMEMLEDLSSNDLEMIEVYQTELLQEEMEVLIEQAVEEGEISEAKIHDWLATFFQVPEAGGGDDFTEEETMAQQVILAKTKELKAEVDALELQEEDSLEAMQVKLQLRQQIVTLLLELQYLGEDLSMSGKEKIKVLDMKIAQYWDKKRKSSSLPQKITK